MRPLTAAEVADRRRERAEILGRLAQMAPLKRRLRAIDEEILSGFFRPPPGVADDQMSLTDADRADIDEAAQQAVEHNARESWRAAVLDILDDGVPLPVSSIQVSLGARLSPAACPGGGDLASLLDQMVSGGAILCDGLRYSRPRTSKARAKKAAPAPLAPPRPPAEGHPQVVLRSWLWARLGQTEGLTLDQLAAELSAFDREDIEDTLHLLYACNLVGDRAPKAGGTVWWATDAGEGTTVDRVVLDTVLAAVRDEGPVSDADVARVLGVTEGLAACVLDELHEAKRIEPAEREASGTPKTWRATTKKRAKGKGQGKAAPAGDEAAS